ncbi:MAG: hypothetical protein ACR2L2_00890 [Acidobacteriota bacterium]
MFRTATLFVSIALLAGAAGRPDAGPIPSIEDRTAQARRSFDAKRDTQP